MDDETFKSFLDTAVAELDERNAFLRDSYEIGSLGRWWFDQSTQAIQFFGPSDELALRCDAVVVGSFALRSSSWRWGWANDSVVPELRRRSEGLRELTKTTGFDIFTQEHAFDIEGEGMAWELVALSVRHLGALGAYRISSSDGQLLTYIALMDVSRVAA